MALLGKHPFSRQKYLFLAARNKHSDCRLGLLFQSVNPENHQFVLVLRDNSSLLRLHKLPHMPVHLGTDQNLTTSGGSAVALGLVHRVANHGELHALRRTDESMHNFTAMNSDPKIAAGDTPKLTRFIQLLYRSLHFHPGPQRIFVVFWIRL